MAKKIHYITKAFLHPILRILGVYRKQNKLLTNAVHFRIRYENCTVLTGSEKRGKIQACTDFKSLISM